MKIHTAIEHNDRVFTLRYTKVTTAELVTIRLTIQ